MRFENYCFFSWDNEISQKYPDLRQKHGDLVQDSSMEAFFSEVLAWRDESAHGSGIGATDLP